MASEDGAESVVGELPTFDVGASPSSSMTKQIEAFAHLAEESRGTFQLDSLQAALEYLIECPFVGTPRRVTQNRTHGGSTTRRSEEAPSSHNNTADNTATGAITAQQLNVENESEINSVSSLAQMRALLQKWRRKCGKTRSEVEYVNRLEKFFQELQYQRRLARYFVQRIYAPLYKQFFDFNILTSLSNDFGLDHADDSEAGVGEDDNGASALFLTECEIPETSEDDVKEAPAKPEQLEAAVQGLTSLHIRWRYLLKDESLFDESYFELTSADALEAVTSSKSDQSQRLALRLLPDLFEKCSAAAAFALEWLGTSEELNPTSIGSKGDEKETDGIEELLKSLRKSLLKKEGDVRRAEHSLKIYQNELKQLNEREDRVLALCNNCEQLERHREEVGDAYQEKIERRVKMVEELENTIQGSQRFRELSAKLKNLEGEINNQYSELKLVEYALNIAANDYDLHMSVQPSFYAYSRTTSDKIERTQRDLKKFDKERVKLERQYERIRDQVEQMRLVMEQADPFVVKKSDDERPATNETYTKYRIDDRYSDKGQASDCSPASGTDGEADGEQSTKLRSTASEAVRPRARASDFPVWPIHNGPGSLVNHSAPLDETKAQRSNDSAP